VIPALDKAESLAALTGRPFAETVRILVEDAKLARDDRVARAKAVA